MLRGQPEQNPSSIVQSSRIEKSCHIVSAVQDCYIPNMTFLRYRWTSRRHTPLWVLLLGMRQPRVMQEVSEEAGVGHVARHRWTRSLRAPMVFRSFDRLVTRRGPPDGTGLPA